MVKLNAEPARITRPIEGGLVPWNPFEELTELRQRMDDLFNRNFTYTPLSRLIPGDHYNFDPPVDILQTEHTIEVFVPLPGFMPEAIKVEVLPTQLVITGERPPLYEAENIVPRATYWATMKATFDLKYPLPVEVNPKEVKATLMNGVLHLVLPIAEEARARFVPVKVIPE
jgi:HSP20 family protein